MLTGDQPNKHKGNRKKKQEHFIFDEKKRIDELYK
jgi:hypothetical protein